MLSNNINTLIKDSIKGKFTFKVKVLRLIKSEFQKYETSKECNKLTEAAEVKILKKLHKQWKEELEYLVQANRPTFDLTLEIKYLETLIPKELSEEEQRITIKDIVDKYISTLSTTPTMGNLREIIKLVTVKYPTINGKLIAEVYKNVLNNN